MVKGAAMGYHIDTKAPENGEWRAKLSLNSAGMKLLPANYAPPATHNCRHRQGVPILATTASCAFLGSV